ncbi:MAG: protein BatD [Magnetococcales bacterium]|nr:protein BatD [Magnetococcales bacterium]
MVTPGSWRIVPDAQRKLGLCGTDCVSALLRILSVLVCLWFWLLPSILEAATIQARVSRDPVIVNESFSLLFSTAESPSGEPDFSPLRRDFELLDQKKSSSFQFLNGQQSHSISWTLELMPKQSGTLTIPAIAFGQERSAPLTIQVLPANARTKPQKDAASTDSELLLEAELTPTEGYIQEQFILTVRFLNAVPIAGATMADPHIATGDAILEKMGQDQAYESERHGQRYLVSERRYALFPQRSGTLGIDPISLTVQQATQGGGSLLKEFFNDPFIKNLPLGPGRPGRTIRLTTPALTRTIQPIPESWKHPHWLPAHKLTLSEQWSQDPPRWQVGEPITRTLTLTADGLTAAQLPSLATSSLDGFKHYPDRPMREDQREWSGILGRQTEKVALIPTTPGEYTLPAIEIPWWNRDLKKIEIARLPERRIAVSPAPTSKATSALTPADAGATPAVPNTTPPVSTTANNLPTATPIPNPESPATPAPQWHPQVWLWVALLCGLGWMITALLWWRTTHRQSSRKEQNLNPDSSRQSFEKRLHRACQRHDAHAARTALNNLETHGSQNKELMHEIERLNSMLYGQTATTWQGTELWRAYQKATTKPSDPHPNQPALLPPLYPT